MGAHPNNIGASMSGEDPEAQLVRARVEIAHQSEIIKSLREYVDTLKAANSRLTDHTNYTSRETCAQQQSQLSLLQESLDRTLLENQRLATALEHERSLTETLRAKYGLLQSLISEKTVDISVPALASMIDTCHQANHTPPPGHSGERKHWPSPLLPSPSPSPLKGPIVFKSPIPAPHTSTPLNTISLHVDPMEPPMPGSRVHTIPLKAGAFKDGVGVTGALKDGISVAGALKNDVSVASALKDGFSVTGTLKDGFSVAGTFKDGAGATTHFCWPRFEQAVPR